MKILILGSKGFIAKNLIISLKKNPKLLLFEVNNKKENNKIYSLLDNIDAVFHLAGVNRPIDQKEFLEGNFGFTSELLKKLKKHNNKCTIMLA